MSEITLSVGGRSYPVSCADGEEEHIRHLASLIEAKLAGLGGAAGDAQGLLFASLVLADEAEEARRGAPAPAAPAASANPDRDDDEMADRLDRMAEQIEVLAEALENAAANA